MGRPAQVRAGQRTPARGLGANDGRSSRCGIRSGRHSSGHFRCGRDGLPHPMREDWTRNDPAPVRCRVGQAEVVRFPNGLHAGLRGRQVVESIAAGGGKRTGRVWGDARAAAMRSRRFFICALRSILALCMPELDTRMPARGGSTLGFTRA